MKKVTAVCISKQLLSGRRGDSPGAIAYAGFFKPVPEHFIGWGLTLHSPDGALRYIVYDLNLLSEG